MQRVFDWITSSFFSPFRRLIMAVVFGLTLFLLLIGSTFALPVLSSSPAETRFSDPFVDQIGFTIQNTDTLDAAYPLAPEEVPEGNGRGEPEEEGRDAPEGYVAPDEPATTTDTSQADCTLEAEFVEGTDAVNELTLSLGESFTGIWELRNSGTCVWDDSYSVQPVPNNAIELVPVPVRIPSILPGDVFEIQLSLVAPYVTGPHLGAWQLEAPSSELFGPLLSAQVLVVEEGQVLEEEVLTDTVATERITATVVPTDTQTNETITPSPLTDTQAITATVTAGTSVPTETTTAVPTELPTEVPTDVPTETPTEAPTDVPTETPTELPTVTPTEQPTYTPLPSATTAPIQVPTNTPTAVLTPTSTIEVAPEAGDEGGITSVLASLPKPLQNPLVLALVLLIPLLFMLLLFLMWRLSRQRGAPPPPAPASLEPPSDDSPSGGGSTFAPRVDQSLSEDTSFDQPNPFEPPLRQVPAPVSQQPVAVPIIQTVVAQPIPVEPVDSSFAPWDSQPSPFAPRSAKSAPRSAQSAPRSATVTAVRPNPPAGADFRPAAVTPPFASPSRLPTEPIAAVWSHKTIDSRGFASDAPAIGTPYLESLARPAGVVYFPLTKRMIKVGRAAENDLIVDESFIGWQTVSRHHAEIERDGEDLFLFDLGTTNGVRINGQQTGSNLLQQDGTISFGQLQFAFRMNKE